MKNCKILLACLLLAVILPTSAQKKKKVPVKRQPKVEAPAENPRYTQMLPMTQKTMFVDSVVVSFDKLLSAISTNPEEGRLYTYNDFFRAPGQASNIVYVNELGTECIFAINSSTGDLQLYSCTLIGNEWSTPTPLQGLKEEGFTDMAFPYMMPDGQTLFFAAKGGSGLGGYDIYHTRLDTKSGRFLKPENIGLPFNSEADDFMYVVCEQDSIGFFATTRRQPEGMVCVYSFVPSATRSIYNMELLDGKQIRDYANIRQISDTWTDRYKLGAAERRLESIRKNAGGKTELTQEDAFRFVIDDKTIYTSMNDFHDSSNATRMREVLSMKKLLGDVTAKLENARKDYAKASQIERKRLSEDILQEEKEQLKLSSQIGLMEKEIRNKELTNKH